MFNWLRFGRHSVLAVAKQPGITPVIQGVETSVPLKRRHDELVQAAVKELPSGSIHIALSFVEQAAKLFFDDSQRREWVVQQLHKTFPEYISRLLVEIAVTLLKREAKQ